MKGLMFIIRNMHEKLGQKIVLTIAVIAVIASTYFSVDIPIKLGESLSELSSYGVIHSVQSTLNEQVGEIQVDFNAMTDEQIEQMLQASNPDFDAAELEKSVGLSVRELLTGDENEYRDRFYDKLIEAGLYTFYAGALMFIFSISLVYISVTSTFYIRQNLFGKLQRLAIKFFDSTSDGDVLSRFTNDIDNIANLINQGGVQIVSSIFLFAFVTYNMLKEQLKLGLIILLLGTVLIVILAFIAKKATKYVSVQQDSLGKLNGYIDEKISGQRVIITNGLEDEVVGRFEPFNHDYRDKAILGQTYSGMLTPIINGFSMLTIALVILFGSRMAIDNVIQIGMLITFVQLAQRFFQPFQTFAAQYNVFQLALSSARRVEEVLDEKEDINTKEGAVQFEKINKSIVLNNLRFGYSKDVEVLKGVDIEVYANRMVALVGPTGSGKTTVMNLLNRFYNVEDGMILYDGVDINDLDVESLRKNVGIVLQDSVLFTGSIYDNICYGKPEATKEEVIEAAKLANIHDYIMTLEKGYDTQVDNQSSVLSTGQKQLISIARTIITDPKLLILDEATSNVDTVTEAKIQKAMENVISNRTSFVIAHRLKTILNADLILVLKDGEIIEHGDHHELVNSDGLYSELYHNQFVFE